jgi:hypothetical protein
MKILLSLVICSQVAGTCLEPFQWPKSFDTQYDCLMFGYEQSIVKMQQIGPVEVNKYNMFIKFYCNQKLLFNLSARPKKGTNKQKV